MLDDIGPDLEEARVRIAATRDALQAASDGHEFPDKRLADLVARLARMAAGVERVEDAVTALLPMGAALASAKSMARPAIHEVWLPGTQSFVHYWPSVW